MGLICAAIKLTPKQVYEIKKYGKTHHILEVSNITIDCPFGEIGKYFWVKEKYSVIVKPDNAKPETRTAQNIRYSADGLRNGYWDSQKSKFVRQFYWRGAWGMCRWASRFTVSITNLTLITEENYDECSTDLSAVAPYWDIELSIEKDLSVPEHVSDIPS